MGDDRDHAELVEERADLVGQLADVRYERDVLRDQATDISQRLDLALADAGRALRERDLLGFALAKALETVAAGSDLRQRFVDRALQAEAERDRLRAELADVRQSLKIVESQRDNARSEADRLDHLLSQAHDEVDAARREPDQAHATARRMSMFERAFWDTQEVLDKALGPDERDGAGEGLAGEVRLLAQQRDQARAELADADRRRSEFDERVSAQVEDLRAELAAQTPGWESPAALQAAYSEILAMCEQAEAERDETRAHLGRTARILLQRTRIVDRVRELRSQWGGMDPAALLGVGVVLAELDRALSNEDQPAQAQHVIEAAKAWYAACDPGAITAPDVRAAGIRLAAALDALGEPPQPTIERNPL